MRIWLVVGVFCLGGCGSFVTLDELKEQAMLTGDWSAVEQRENVIARRAAQRGPSCAGDTVAYCEVRVGDKRCACIDRAKLGDIFASRY